MSTSFDIILQFFTLYSAFKMYARHGLEKGRLSVLDVVFRCSVRILGPCILLLLFFFGHCVPVVKLRVLIYIPLRTSLNFQQFVYACACVSLSLHGRLVLIVGTSPVTVCAHKVTRGSQRKAICCACQGLQLLPELENNTCGWGSRDRVFRDSVWNDCALSTRS